MWTRFFLTSLLCSLASLSLFSAGCGAADWTITRTHAHPLAELRARRHAPPQVVVVQMPAAPATVTVTASKPALVTLEREPAPVAPQTLTAPLAPAVPLVVLPAIPAVTPKRVQVTIEK